MGVRRMMLCRLEDGAVRLGDDLVSCDRISGEETSMRRYVNNYLSKRIECQDQYCGRVELANAERIGLRIQVMV